MKIKTTKEILKKYALRTNGDLALLDVEDCPSKVVSNDKWIDIDSMIEQFKSILWVLSAGSGGANTHAKEKLNKIIKQLEKTSTKENRKEGNR